MTRVLGAVLAGGDSRRFGSDKALATLHGVPLIEHVIAALRPQCAAVLVCGRVMAGIDSVADRPAAGLGPLGGLAAALHTGRQRGFDLVVSVPCDTPELPDNLLALLGPAPAVLAELPVIGLWPCALAPRLDAYLAGGGRRSMRAWASEAEAALRHPGLLIRNLNTVADLDAVAGTVQPRGRD